MKYIKLLLTILLISFLSTAKAKQGTKTTEYSTFIKVWGFLKYYHPKVASGELDWDQVFLSRIKDLKPLNSKESRSEYYLKWIESLGPIKACSNCPEKTSGDPKLNLKLDWKKEAGIFDNVLINKLSEIQKNKNHKTNFYVKPTKGTENAEFTNEKNYVDSIYPSQQMRLLTLARYWNMVNYFFPYRYQTTQTWDSALVEMTPKFLSAQNETVYHLAITELTAKVNDSHAKFSTLSTVKHFGTYWVPFKFNVINKKAVVTGFFNESLSRKNDIQIGDAFTSIEGKSIDELIRTNSKYIGASNSSVINRDIHTIIFHGSTNNVKTTFERNGKILDKTVTRFLFNDLNYSWGQDLPKETIKLLENNIGYVNMGNLTVSQVPELIKKLKNSKAIIFDVRNYPRGTLYYLANFLNKEPKPFVKIARPDYNYPGNFNIEQDLFCGKKNPDYYKGKVVLLCNETTQSHAEFTLMALQTAPNVITIGSQTSGADGNVSLITLPGNFKTYITGLGIFYPDGSETQRVGIIPNIEIKPTLKGIIEGKDEVLERALQVINDVK